MLLQDKCYRIVTEIDEENIKFLIIFVNFRFLSSSTASVLGEFMLKYKKS